MCTLVERCFVLFFSNGGVSAWNFSIRIPLLSVSLKQATVMEMYTLGMILSNIHNFPLAATELTAAANSFFVRCIKCCTLFTIYSSLYYLQR